MRLIVLLLCMEVVRGQYQNLYPVTSKIQSPGQNIQPPPQSTFTHYQPSFTNMTNPFPLTRTGASVQFAMRAYNDPQSRTPDGGVCHCPESLECGGANKCLITFTFIVATPNQPSQIFETPEVALDEVGDAPQAKINEWGRLFVVPDQGRPSSLDLLVHHRGFTYDDTGRPTSAEKLILVDQFHIDLAPILPSVGGVQNMQTANDYLGSILNTRMSLALSLSCTGSLIGPDCDLACNRSSINANVAACRSNSTGYFAICNWTGNQQVENCKRCPWGIKEDTYCQDEDGGVLDIASAGVVDTSYKTATIILAILLVIVLVLLALVVITLCLKNRRLDKKQEPLPGHNVRHADSAAARPLLSSQRHSTDSGPTPLPRHVPPEPSSSSLPSLPPKSALRRPMLPPPAHLGGSNSINDSANTSYNDVPMRPSRSEVV